MAYVMAFSKPPPSGSRFEQAKTSRRRRRYSHVVPLKTCRQTPETTRKIPVVDTAQNSSLNNMLALTLALTELITLILTV